MSVQNKKRIFVSGGGTGGHIYPAVAVCDYLNNTGEYEIFYVGNPKNMEYSIVQEKGYTFLPVNVSGMPRKLNLSFFVWCINLFCSIFVAMFYLLKYRPQLVFGTGGYVSAPILFAVSILKCKNIPYALHDCDAQPGLVTRKFAPKAKVVSLAFEGAKRFVDSANIVVFGNPIRKDFKNLSKSQARECLGLQNKITVCITGGSQGANSINMATIGILKDLSQNNIQVIFQTGKKNYEEVLKKLSEIYPEYEVDNNLIIKPYFADMTKVLKASDIVVSRAGSLSLSEICAVPAAAILIPYPYAAADHQRKNARFVEEKGAAIYIEDSELSSEILLRNILTFINDKEALCHMSQNALKLANYDAVDNICSILDGIVKNV